MIGPQSVEQDLRDAEGSVVELALADGTSRRGKLIRVDVHAVAELEDADGDELFVDAGEIDEVEVVSS